MLINVVALSFKLCYKIWVLSQAFSYLDADGDGHLSAEDLTRAGGRDVEGMIAEADLTGTGQVTLQEFVAVMMRTVLFKSSTR